MYNCTSVAVRPKVFKKSPKGMQKIEYIYFIYKILLILELQDSSRMSPAPDYP